MIEDLYIPRVPEMAELSLHDALRRDRNNLDIVRLLFALMVIYGHSFHLTPGANQGDDLIYLYTGYYAGDLAIKGFFFISGILVTSSLIASRSPLKYLMARVFRIIPALVVVTLILTLVIGPMVSTLPALRYFNTHETWRYLWRTSLLQIWNGQSLGYYYLPGVFTTNPFPNFVNAPLWSVNAEFYCYLLLLAVFLCTGLSKVSSSIMFCLIAVDSILPNKEIFYWIPQSNSDFSLLPLSFAFGSLLAVYQGEIKLHASILVGLLFVSYLIGGGNFGHIFGYAVFFVAILVFAASAVAMKLRLPRDVSYGVYLWGCPIQQLFAQFFPGAPHLVALTVCIGGSIILGYFSSILIEEPAQTFGRWLVRRTPALLLSKKSPGAETPATASPAALR